MQFRAAQALDPTDSITTSMYYHAVRCFNVERAEDILLDFLENQNPFDKKIKGEYLAFLRECGKEEETKYFRNLRLACKQKVLGQSKDSP